MATVLDNEILKEVYSEFQYNLIKFANSELGIREYVHQINPDFLEFIQAQGQNIVDICNSFEKQKVRDHRSLVNNMKMGINLVKCLLYYIDFQKDDGKELTLDEIRKVMAEISQLMVAIKSCLNNMMMDCFFHGVNFLGKPSSNYNEFFEHMEKTENFYKRIDDIEKESVEILKKMRAAHKGAIKEGLTRSYKASEKKLSRRIFGFDVLNYLSLALIFMVTLTLFIDISTLDFSKFEYKNVEIFKFIRLKNISLYERFLLIVPLICLSWFASKRSQFLYQIREEYSYKYATALAYEGYKDEIENSYLSDEMKNRLMEVTIDNLARSPLEQFDKNSDHAPYVQVLKEINNIKK